MESGHGCGVLRMASRQFVPKRCGFVVEEVETYSNTEDLIEKAPHCEYLGEDCTVWAVYACYNDGWSQEQVGVRYLLNVPGVFRGAHQGLQGVARDAGGALMTARHPK